LLSTPGCYGEGTAIVIITADRPYEKQVDAMRNFSTNDDVAHFPQFLADKIGDCPCEKRCDGTSDKLLLFAPESLTKEENIEFLKNIKIFLC